MRALFISNLLNKLIQAVMSAVKRRHWKNRFEDSEEGLIVWLLRMKEQGNIPDGKTNAMTPPRVFLHRAQLPSCRA